MTYEMDMDQVGNDYVDSQTKRFEGGGRLYGTEIKSIGVTGSEPDQSGTLHWIDNYFRFMPPPRDARVPYVEVGIHFNVAGVEGNVALCPRFPEKNPQGECYICQLGEHLASSADPQQKKFGKGLKVSTPRYLWNVIPLSDEEAAAEGIHQLIISKTVHGALLGLMMDPKITRMVENIPRTFVDFDYGRLINIRRKGKTVQNTEYTVVNYDPEAVPPQVREWHGAMKGFSEMIFFFHAEDMKRMLNGELVKQDTAQYALIPFNPAGAAPTPGAQAPAQTPPVPPVPPVPPPPTQQAPQTMTPPAAQTPPAAVPPPAMQMPGAANPAPVPPPPVQTPQAPPPPPPPTQQYPNTVPPGTQNVNPVPPPQAQAQAQAQTPPLPQSPPLPPGTQKF